MYTLVLLIAWIAGISSMGYIVPVSFRAFVPVVYCISSMLILFNIFKLSNLGAVYLRWLTLLFLSLSVFLLGQHYAQSALQQRLKHRFMQIEDTSQIVYINRMNELSHTHGGAGTKQIAMLAPDLTRIGTQQSRQENHAILLYVQDNHPDQYLQIGQYYKVSGRIKPAHSYAVANVFDQEKWLIQQNIMATMQVDQVELLTYSELQSMGYGEFLKENSSWKVKIVNAAEQQRLNFRKFIQKQNFKNKGLLLALLTGDESLLSDSIKTQFRTLGISHLLAISGPHILVFAVLFCFMLNGLISKCIPHLFQKIPRPYLLVLPFIFCVMLYTAFVGFEIPAMRTLLTVTIVSLALLLKQHIQTLKLLLFSASILLLLDPFSILSAAFWLSYGACFILIRVYQTMTQQYLPISALLVPTWQSKVGSFIQLLFNTQWKVFLALFPLVAIIFQQLSWISPLVNMVAIPLIGLVIVPLDVIAAMLSVVSEPLGLFFFHCADGMLSLLLLILKMFEYVFQPHLNWLSLSVVSILSIGIGIVIVFLPRQVVPKAWAILCFMPIFLPSKIQHTFALTVLDVGQGQAIHVEIDQQNLMIDTGGSYDETKFSIGRQLVIPYLMGKGVSQLDQVYLSHLDQDHAGAFSEIEKAIEIKKVSSNEWDSRFEGVNFDYCYAGQAQQWGSIKLTILAPAQQDLSDVQYNKNELSCVIYIQVPQSKGYQNFLIMGDAGWQAEYQLLQRYPDLKVDVLLLGHHGSRHSSSYDFLKRLHPKLAIASAGFGNRYQHPHPLVSARLGALSIPFKSTIQQGSIQFSMDRKGDMSMRSLRDSSLWLKR